MPKSTVRHYPRDASLLSIGGALLEEFIAGGNDEDPGNVSPFDLADYSWKCAAGEDHRWVTKARNRITYGHRCPFCTGRSLSVTNNLETLYPGLAAEFDVETNGLTAAEVLATTKNTSSYDWQCRVSKDHRWQSPIAARLKSFARRNTRPDCPFCAGREASSTSSLHLDHPELAAELDVVKGGLTADEIGIRHLGRLWWRCRLDPKHSWSARLWERVERKASCPACAARGRTVDPKVGAQEELNSPRLGLGVVDVDQQPTPDEDESLWWVCTKNVAHRYQARPDTQDGNGGVCLFCWEALAESKRTWSAPKLRRFLEAILDHIDALAPAELFALVAQSGLMASHRRKIGQALVAGTLDKEELRRFTLDSSATASDLEMRIRQRKATTRHENPYPVDGQASTVASGKDLSAEAHLPTISVRDALNASSAVAAMTDESVANYLLFQAVAKCWAAAYVDLESARAEALESQVNGYAELVRTTFLAQLSRAEELVIPPGYSFGAAESGNDDPIPPNLMQRHVASDVVERRRVGNWSAPGAGKTLSAVLASRCLEAQITVILCPNAVVGELGDAQTGPKGWVGTIWRTFPHAEIQLRTLQPQWATDGPRYLVINYELLQQAYSEDKIRALTYCGGIDMIVVDEIHFVKQRSEDASKRKLMAKLLIDESARNQPNLAVLGMSATPVVNNLTEAKSLIELVGGIDMPLLDTKASIANAVGVHQELVKLGTRWVPKYDMEVREARPSVDCSEVLDDIQALGRRPNPQMVEALLTPFRLAPIVDAVDGKTLIYTYFVEGIVEQLVAAIRNSGYSVGLHTATDKSGLNGFLYGDTQVLIGTSTIATGKDGLQAVCNNLIVNSLPWTASDYEQLIGRLYRQGQAHHFVKVTLPRTYAVVDGVEWSWCDARLGLIKAKRSLADAAVDGIISETTLPTPNAATQAVLRWLADLRET